MRRHIASSLSLGIVGTALACMLAAAAPAGNDSRDRQVLSSVQELMDAIVDPSADALWNAVGTVVDKDAGIVEMAPKTDEEWHDVRRGAVRLIEGANLLRMPGRLAAPAGTKSETPG